jgi:hypothetical protein
MAGNPPGPLCVATLGSDWIDAGTMCLARSDTPGTTGPLAWRRDPFSSVHATRSALVYSRAKEATWKRRFDEQMALAGVTVSASSGLYWRSLLGCLSCSRVCPGQEGLQFFVIRGGYEGFLAKGTGLSDANRSHWDGRTEGTSDINDALVVLDGVGTLVGAFQLAVPNYYPRTARMVASDWDGRAVFAYHNATWDYEGLAVLDRGKLPAYDPKIGKYEYWIDIHHKKYTAGCIEIASAAMPATRDFDAFVRAISKSHGRSVDESFFRAKSGYSTAGLAGSKAVPFTVHMKHFLGRIFVVEVPQ